jgi:hypothetical protein
MLNGQLFERIVRKTTLIVGAPTTFHVKLDEVIRALHHADNFMIAVESLSEDELDRLISHYRAIRLVRGLAPAPEIYHGGSERLDADGGEGPSSA